MLRMTVTAVHSATVTREGKWWIVRIPEIAGLTQARRLGEAELMAREYVAVTLGVPLESVAVELTVAPVGGIDVTGRLAEIRDARQRADALEQAAASGAIALAKELAALSVPRRDIGAILGVSFQRADQLVRS